MSLRWSNRKKWKATKSERKPAAEEHALSKTQTQECDCPGCLPLKCPLVLLVTFLITQPPQLQQGKDVWGAMNSSSEVPLVKENRWRVSCWGLPAEAQIQGVWSWLGKLLFSGLSTETTWNYMCCLMLKPNLAIWGNSLNTDDMQEQVSTMWTPCLPVPLFQLRFFTRTR